MHSMGLLASALDGVKDVQINSVQYMNGGLALTVGLLEA